MIRSVVRAIGVAAIVAPIVPNASAKGCALDLNPEQRAARNVDAMLAHSLKERSAGVVQPMPLDVRVRTRTSVLQPTCKAQKPRACGLFHLGCPDRSALVSRLCKRALNVTLTIRQSLSVTLSMPILRLFLKMDGIHECYYEYSRGDYRRYSNLSGWVRLAPG